MSNTEQQQPASASVDLPLHQSPELKSNPGDAIDLFNSSAFGSHVEELLSEWHAPGLAAAIVHEQTTISRAWGAATLKPLRKCTPDTLFDLASSSKSMTAAAVGLLVENNEKYPNVQWNAVMNQLLPDDFVMSKEEHTRSVTVEDILSHRSGLPSHDSSYLGISAEYPDNARSITRNLRNLGIAAPIRSKWMYCNLMFTVATYLVEKLSGTSFEQFLHQHFFGPLDMKSSQLQPEAVRRAGLEEQAALPYEWSEEKQMYNELPPEQTPESQGAGSIYTSVNDYIKYVKAVMNQEGPITRSLYDGLTRLRAFCNPDMTQDFDPFSSMEAYAVGWETYWYRGTRIVRHDGSISGFGSVHFFVPDYKFGGVILSNSDGGGSVCPVLMSELVDELLGIPQTERINWSIRQRASEDRYHRKIKEGEGQLRKELLSVGDGQAQRQRIPLGTYVGEYWNAGYHGFQVGIKNDQLYVDASDRSANGFHLTFEHIREQTQYIAHLGSGDATELEELKAEFRFENDRVIKLGVQLEEDLEDLIWFDRV